MVENKKDLKVVQQLMGHSIFNVGYEYKISLVLFVINQFVVQIDKLINSSIFFLNITFLSNINFNLKTLCFTSKSFYFRTQKKHGIRKLRYKFVYMFSYCFQT